MIRLPGGTPIGGGANGLTSWSQTMSPLAIVMLVLVLGASFYLWRQGYLRSRAGLITIVAVVIILIYLGFFANRPPT